jgi:hypothetical protein
MCRNGPHPAHGRRGRRSDLVPPGWAACSAEGACQAALHMPARMSSSPSTLAVARHRMSPAKASEAADTAIYEGSIMLGDHTATCDGNAQGGRVPMPPSCSQRGQPAARNAQQHNAIDGRKAVGMQCIRMTDRLHTMLAYNQCLKSRLEQLLGLSSQSSAPAGLTLAFDPILRCAVGQCTCPLLAIAAIMMPFWCMLHCGSAWSVSCVRTWPTAARICA